MGRLRFYCCLPPGPACPGRCRGAAVPVRSRPSAISVQEDTRPQLGSISKRGVQHTAHCFNDPCRFPVLCFCHLVLGGQTPSVGYPRLDTLGLDTRGLDVLVGNTLQMPLFEIARAMNGLSSPSKLVVHSFYCMCMGPSSLSYLQFRQSLPRGIGWGVAPAHLCFFLCPPSFSGGHFFL